MNNSFVYKSSNSNVSPNRYGGEHFAGEFRSDLDTVVIDLAEEVKSLEAFSLWAKLSDNFSSKTAFDVVVMDFDENPAGSNLRFRHDGINNPNSLITASTDARHIDFRGDWFFERCQKSQSQLRI